MTDATIPVTLFSCNASDDALACGIDDIEDDHQASISKASYDTIVAARNALDANPAWDCIAINSDMECRSLEDVFDASTIWQTGVEQFLIYRFNGLYLRLQHKHNRQAEIEFEVAFQDGMSIPAPADALSVAT